MLQKRLGTLLLFLAATAVGCGTEAPPPTAGITLPPGKIPITSSSEDAIAIYLEARDAEEKLRVAEARQLYREALDLDPEFALAHFGLVYAAETYKDAMSALSAAADAANKASEAERWLIHGTQFGVNSNPAAQHEYYSMLVEAFPEDERAHNAMGDFFFEQQRYSEALKHYLRANEINPDYSPATNNVGYTYRMLGNFEEAEKAFQRYIAQIPGEPNPYDSYAELLMRMGSFEASIANYRKALEKDPAFFSSYVGIALNQVFLGSPQQARATLQELADASPNVEDQRNAHYWTAASYVFQDRIDDAVAALGEVLELARTPADQARELREIGTLNLEAGRVAQAREAFDEANLRIESAELSEFVKHGWFRNDLYWQARCALAAGEVEDAGRLTAEYREQVAVRSVADEVMRVHELEGRLAMARRDWERALEELDQADQEDPRVLYLQARTCLALGAAEEAKVFARQVVGWNGQSLTYGFVRGKAAEIVQRAG